MIVNDDRKDCEGVGNDGDDGRKKYVMRVRMIMNGIVIVKV